MKIGMVYRHAFCGGGYPRDIRWLAGALADHGHDVTLVGNPQRDKADGLTSAVQKASLDSLPGMLSQFDVVHCFNVYFRETLSTVWRCGKHRIPVVIWPLAQLLPANIKNRFLQKRLYFLFCAPVFRRVSAVHCFSSAEVETVWRIWSFRKAQIMIAGLGIFPESVADISSQPAQTTDDFSVLFFGRNDVHQKGIDILLKGWRVFLDRIAGQDGRPCELTIGGRAHADSDRRINDLISSMDLTDVKLVGEKTLAERDDLMRESSLFAFLSRFDGPPRPIREAIGMGTPVLVSRETNMADLVNAFQAGAGVALVPEYIAEVLYQAWCDPQLVRQWRGNVLALRDRLSWARVAEEYINGYESLVHVPFPGSR